MQNPYKMRLKFQVQYLRKLFLLFQNEKKSFKFLLELVIMYMDLFLNLGFVSSKLWRVFSRCDEDSLKVF